jgi:GTP pyrophosphokinase/guanosine-3',5'-bis(diphosphate) 3'-pyrophosphohydrolase
MSIRSFAADLLPAKRHPPARTTPPPEPGPEVSTFAALSEKLDYLGKADLKKVREAYKFADEAHLGQLRASGIPYITHPLAVAGLVADWKLDVQALVAALTHDTMEDCGVTKPELIERFGAPTADLVDGLTKLDKLQFSTREEGQAESFRKMLLAMSRDVRVILIKLCDRLHNMRTMEAMSADKRARIARETIEIYAPIAHRLGLNQMYRELQELSFRFIHPWRYGAIAKALERARGTRRDIVDRMRRDVESAFIAARRRVTVFSREKTVFSIYRKMREKHAGFAQVNDIFGFRVVVGALDECYQSLGTLHQMYKPVPGRFKDYIAIPKANGYQSLHTTLVNPLGTAVEFQVRTEQMHAVAEAGIAAHWMYKATSKDGRDGKGGPMPDEAQRLGAMWLQSLIDIQSDTHDSSEFLEHVKIDLFPEAVYVFTPKSKILALPRGATPIDFAYAIHSDVGDHCVAAKVNGEPVALRTELKSGDVVEVSTAPNARPNPSWLNSVRTGRARSKIRHFLKNLEQEESIALGEKLLSQALRSEGMPVPADDEANAAVWQALTRWSGSRSRAELMIDIGLGRKISSIVAKRLAQLLGERGARPDALTLTLGRYAEGDAQPVHNLVEIDGSEGASVQLATCCRPIPGDEVAGHFGGEGLTVHTADCSIGRRLKERDAERWMNVDWAEVPTRAFETTVTVLVRNAKGALAQVAQAISSAEADITHIDMGNERAAESTELRLLVSVRDRLHLADVLRTLKRAAVVMRAARVKP